MADSTVDPTTQRSLPPFQRPERMFHWADYLVFSLVLAVTAVVGIYYGIKMRKNATVKDILMGNRKLRVIPVSLSLLATLVSSLVVIGIPSETYYAGEWPLYLGVAFLPATVITAHIFIPIFHRLEVTSAYEYLGLRFNRTIRWMGSIVFTILMLVTQALSVYTPAIAFSLVAGISMEVSVLAAGLVCTFYTSLGGMRAVVVTDIIQVLIILGGVVGLLVKGAIDAGGVAEVFRIAENGNRLQLWNYNLATNATFGLWAQFLGGSFVFLNLFSSNQTSIQRYCSIKKCRDAQKAVYVSMILYVVSWMLVLLLGLVIYTFYYQCDPLLRQVIYSPDQIVPLFIMDTLGHLHGLPGLFTACVFGAVLSTVSSGINSLAAVSLEDMIRPLHRSVSGNEISERKAMVIARALALFYGIVTIGLAYLPVQFGTFLLNIDVTFSVYGVFGGPLLGVFVLGTMFPIANSVGAGVGLAVGVMFDLWMWIGRILCSSSGNDRAPPETPTECLDIYNETTYTAADPPVLWPSKSLFSNCPLQPLYDISYLWYGLIGTGITLFIGTLVSFCSCGDRGNVVDPSLMCFGNRCCVKTLERTHPTTRKATPKGSKPHGPLYDNDSDTGEIYQISTITAAAVAPDHVKLRTKKSKAHVLW